MRQKAVPVILCVVTGRPGPCLLYTSAAEQGKTAEQIEQEALAAAQAEQKAVGASCLLSTAFCSCLLYTSLFCVFIRLIVQNFFQPVQMPCRWHCVDVYKRQLLNQHLCGAAHLFFAMAQV